MRKFLLMSSALVAGGLLNGLAEAACIQTPICSSLGYTSSSACDGGIKCPFGNAWNCTGPNNTTEINKLKTEISSIKTDISNIQTNITDLTNRITNIENNSGSGTGGYSVSCLGCNIGNFYYNGNCYDVNASTIGSYIQKSYIVYAKEDGKCKAVSLYSAKGVAIRDLTDADLKIVSGRLKGCVSNAFVQSYGASFYIKSDTRTVYFRDGDSASYQDFVMMQGCHYTDNSILLRFSDWRYTKAEFEDKYYSTSLPVPEAISF